MTSRMVQRPSRPQLFQFFQPPLDFGIAGHFAALLLAGELNFELPHHVANFQLRRRTQAIDKQLAVDVIGFVLQHAGQKTFGLEYAPARPPGCKRRW